MPTTLKKSLVQGAAFEVTPDTKRLVVPCMLKTVDIDGANDVEVLVNCEAALQNEHGIAIGDSLSAAHPNLLLWRIQIQPVVEKIGKDVWVNLEYLWEPNEFAPTMYTVRDSTVNIMRDTYYIPGTNITIKAKFDAVAGGGTTEGALPIAAVVQDLCKMRLWMPARSISISALRYGRPSGGPGDRQCYVNHADWPVGNVQLLPGRLGGSPISAEAATPKAKGFWMLSEYTTDWYPNSGQSLVRANATTQSIEDWSTILFVENRETGKRPFGAYTAAQQATLMTSLLSPAYSYSVIASVNGATRVGPYPMINFQSLFGF